jgi:hypothetical protein
MHQHVPLCDSQACCETSNQGRVLCNVQQLLLNFHTAVQQPPAACKPSVHVSQGDE